MNKRVFSYFLSLILILTMSLTGCGQATVEKETSDNSYKAKKVEAKSGTEGLTVLDIKKKYGSDGEKAIMPMYNVAKDEEFLFKFESDLSELSSYDIASVHTDIKCLDESRIHSFISDESLFDIQDVTSDIIIKPSSWGVLASEADKKSTKSSWGNAPIYYIRINYDMNASTATILEKPIVIPFTVRSEAPVPNLRYEISRDGRFKLVWDPVEGAEKYNVYKASSITLLETKNNPLNGAEKGYTGVWPMIEVTTKETMLDDFISSNNGSLISFDNGEIVTGQNRGVNGEYYVTAVVNGRESNFSMPVNTIELSKKLPLELKSDITFSRFDNVSELPKRVSVEYIDGSVEDKDVAYEIDGLQASEYGATQVWFRVKGTAIRSYVSVDKMSKEDIAKLEANKADEAASGYVEAKNSTDMVPNPDVPTIIAENPQSSEATPTSEPADDSKDKNSEENVVEMQKENTEKQIEEGNQEVVKEPELLKDVQLAADSALEEYLVLQMLNGEREITLKAFPEAQNFETLSDTIQKVMYQNSLIIGVKEYGYKYSTLTLVIGYNDSADEITRKQKEILLEANKILDSTITSDMTDEQKRKALYDYLNDNTKYDAAALESAEQNNFMYVDEKYNDSFTTYGIMVKKVGVCMSYAYTYKILCDMAGVACIVITGDIDGMPHAWNKVKIDNEWVHVDATNNLTNSGIPYMIYNANDEVAIQTAYSTDNSYWIDSELDIFVGISNRHEYYTVNGLEVSSMEAYKSILTEKLKKGENLIVLRFACEIDQEQLINNTVEAFYSVAKDRLDTAEMGGLGNYIILSY